MQRQVAGVYDWPEDIGYDRQPFTSLSAGAGAWVAGPDGLILGRFGWADPSSGQVTNTYAAGLLLGWVLPVYNLWNWQRAYRAGPDFVLRSAQQCVLASAGDFNARFALGANALDQVYVDPTTGEPLSGNSTNPDAIAAPWRVMRSGGCGARIRISTWTVPIN